MEMKVLNIAHRGASGFYLENTKSSFLEAIKQGADIIELDVQLTKDKELVVIHDEKINRLSNGNGKVIKKNLQELKNYDFGKEKDKILTLREALELLKDCRVIIELKKSLKGYENLALEEIKKSKNENIWVQSPYKSILRNLRNLDPKIKLGYILLFSIPSKQIFNYHHYFSKKHNISFFTIHQNFLNKIYLKKYIPYLKKRGINVFIWTVNDPSSIHKFIKWGADGIITNNPSLLKDLIKSVY